MIFKHIESDDIPPQTNILNLIILIVVHKYHFYAKRVVKSVLCCTSDCQLLIFN